MNLKVIIASILCWNNGLAIAGAMGDVSSPAPRFYVGAEGGASISLDTHFQPQLGGGETFTFVAPNNTDWNRDLGIGGFGGLLAGYQYNPNVALQFTWDHRTGYDYNLQASYGVDVTNPNYFLQDHFETGNINVQTFLVDLLLKPSVNWGGFEPYIKGGIGLAYNQMSTLRNVQLTFAGTPVSYDNRTPGDSATSFAWDAGVGADYFFSNKVSIGLGYRFVDAGTLRTKNTFTNASTGVVSTITPFETKHFFLNEFVASIAYHFDYV